MGAFTCNETPITKPKYAKTHPKLGAFYDNLLKIHSIYVQNWALSFAMKPPSLYQNMRNITPKGRHVNHVSDQEPPPLEMVLGANVFKIRPHDRLTASSPHREN